jgi:hypothetical protein
LIYCDSAEEIKDIDLRTMVLIQEVINPSEGFIIRLERNSCDTNGRVTKGCTPSDIPTVVVDYRTREYRRNRRIHPQGGIE